MSLILAEIKPGFLIWIVIMAIFGLVNLVKKQQEKAKQQPRPKPRPRPPPTQPQQQQRRSASPEDAKREMEDLYRRLTGAEPRKSAPQPRKPAPQPQARRTAPPPPLPAGQSDPRIRLAPKPPPPDPRITITPPPLSTPVPEVSDQALEDAFGKIEEAEEMMGVAEMMEHHAGGAHNTVGTRSMMVDLRHLTVPVMRIPVIPVDTVDQARKKPDLSQRQRLRDAVLGRVLLEPPKALQPTPSENADEI